MPRGKKTIQRAGLSVVLEPETDANPSGPERTAALAAINLAQQSPGLVIPRLCEAPTSYSLTEAADTAVILASNLTRLGLGSLNIWKRVNGNPSAYIKASLQAWLNQLGASKLANVTELYFGITDVIDEIPSQDNTLIYALLEVGSCGGIGLGRLLDALEAEEAGLGHAFYVVLIQSLNRWMRTFDLADAERWFDYMKEGVEQDFDPDSELSFEQECEARGIDMPNMDKDVPACVPRGYLYNKKLRSLLPRLKRHARGPYGKYIEPILNIVAIKPRTVHEMFCGENFWDDPPLPSWVVFFRGGDCVSQAFDDESQTMNECTHQPTWITAFDPSDIDALRVALEEVQKFVTINLEMLKLAQATEELEKTHASIRQDRRNSELLAA